LVPPVAPHRHPGDPARWAEPDGRPDRGGVPGHQPRGRIEAPGRPARRTAGPGPRTGPGM